MADPRGNPPAREASPQGAPPGPGRPSEPALRQLIYDNADGILVLRPGGVVVFANSAASHLLRPEGGPLVGTDFGHPAVAGDLTEIDIPATGHAVEMRVSRIEWEGAPALLSSLREITERRSAERSRLQLAAIVESSADAIVGLSARGEIEIWNAGAELLYGYSHAEVLGCSILVLATPDTFQAREHALHQLLSSGRGAQTETRDRRKDGSVVDVSVTSSPIRDPSGVVVGVARVARDISEQKRVEHELTFMANHDPLTGLFNRRRMNEELTHLCAMAVRYRESGALLLGDIDHFKSINDSLGHQAGDEVIRRVAQAINVRLRDTDLAARLGGDEFAVLLPGTDLNGARRTAESLRAAVTSIEVPSDENRIPVSISFGVTVIAGPAASPADVLGAADVAMYAAKREGRNRVMVERTQPARDAAAEVLVPSERLRAALRGRRFELHAQPVVDLTTGAIGHYELLLRLRQDGALLLPEAFLGAAERSGLIGDIDRWVVRQALKAVSRHGDAGPVLSINLSGTSIDDDSLPQLIEHSTCRRAIPPARLNFELSEQAATAHLDTARRLIDRLHHAGCTVALDDFGSGFGSFRQLRYLPIDYLKIDGSLIRHLPGNDLDRLVVKAIVDVGRGLKRHTVAKHVDSEEGLVLLRELGVQYGQGFHLGRPRPLDGSATEAPEAPGATKSDRS